MITEMSKGYQLTIPASWRKQLNLQPGSKIEMEKKGRRIVLTPFEPLNLEEVWKKIDSGPRINIEPEKLVKMKRELYGVR